MTTPAHWCPVPDLVMYDPFDSDDYLKVIHCSKDAVVMESWEKDLDDRRRVQVATNRKGVEQLRDHLTELLKHMPEDSQ